MYNPVYPKGITFPNDNFIYGQGTDLIIIAGWSPVHIISQKINKPYAAMGNLYSTSMGITSIVRNLYINPQITEIDILSLTKADSNSGSCQCLYDFLNNGTTFDNSLNKHKINSEIDGYIDGEIPYEDLEILRKSVKYAMYRDLKDYVPI